MNPSDPSHEAKPAGDATPQPQAQPAEPPPELIRDLVIPFIPTEEDLANYYAMHSKSWTRHLRPVNAPAPDWYKPQPPTPRRRVERAAPQPAPDAEDTPPPSPAGEARQRADLRGISAEPRQGTPDTASRHEAAKVASSTHSTQGHAYAETADGETSPGAGVAWPRIGAGLGCHKQGA